MNTGAARFIGPDRRPVGGYMHSFCFDPTYGYGLDGLLRVEAPAPPEDFESFWRDTYRRTREVEPRPALRRVGDNHAGAVYEVEFNGLDGFRVGGWVTVAAGAKEVSSRGVVMGHGYSGREGPDERIPGPPAVTIFPCARGFNRSARPGLPSTAARHVLHGIESRETYLHRACAADLWAATSALEELFPNVRGRMHFVGSSFGGGIGAMALPWEPRWSRALLDVPSFGNHPLRVTLECVGSGEAVRSCHRREREVLGVLAYFDAASAATFAQIPVMAAAALFDPAVPPPGQFAAYNALAGPKRLVVKAAAHFTHPGSADDEAHLFAEASDWFSH